jgi:hypothetical protein
LGGGIPLNHPLHYESFRDTDIKMWNRSLSLQPEFNGCGDASTGAVGRALEFQLKPTIIHKRPEHERKQQDIDAPNHPQNQRSKVVPANERSEPIDEVKQWMFHGCHTRVLVKTQRNSGVNRTLDDETNQVAVASKSERI